MSGFGVSGWNTVVFVTFVDAYPATIQLVFGNADSEVVIIGAVEDICF